MKIGYLIKLHRFTHEQGIREAAKLLGVSPATLSRIENNKPIDAATQLKLINYFFGS